MSIEINLESKRVLVAGGSSGIGLGIARKFLEAGASVAVTGTRASWFDYEDSAAPEGIDYQQLNVRNNEEIEALAAGFEVLDVLVSSVGIVAYGGKEFQPETFRDVVDVNLNGVMNLCAAFREQLTNASDGAIVLVGSTSSFIATPGQPAYSASKGALVTLTKSLAQAWAKYGIRVNGIAPGFVATKLTQRSRDDQGVYEDSLKRIPMRRWGEPEEMGSSAVFLASPLSSYVTGQMLLVDGGITLM